MTREIKFRAFNKVTKVMYYNVEQVYEGCGGITDRDGNELDPYCGASIQVFCQLLNHPDFIVMQYTGLKDKNGKEIYEGDIVKVIEEDGGAYIKRKESYQIVFDEKNASFMLSEYYHMNYFSSWIIIGNIYQNPELLK